MPRKEVSTKSPDSREYNDIHVTATAVDLQGSSSSPASDNKKRGPYHDATASLKWFGGVRRHPDSGTPGGRIITLMSFEIIVPAVTPSCTRIQCGISHGKDSALGSYLRRPRLRGTSAPPSGTKDTMHAPAYKAQMNTTTVPFRSSHADWDAGHQRRRTEIQTVGRTRRILLV